MCLFTFTHHPRIGLRTSIDHRQDTMTPRVPALWRSRRQHDPRALPCDNVVQRSAMDCNRRVVSRRLLARSLTSRMRYIARHINLQC
jgi:hypothetical protein